MLIFILQIDDNGLNSNKIRSFFSGLESIDTYVLMNSNLHDEMHTLKEICPSYENLNFK